MKKAIKEGNTSKMRVTITSARYLWISVVAFLAFTSVGVGVHVPHASAAGCTVPTAGAANDYGTVSFNSANGNAISVPASGTYYIWTRMSAADTTNNTYNLDIDGASCFTVGGSGVPTYAAGAAYFTGTNASNPTTSQNSNWISKTSGGARLSVSLTAGSHNLKMIGTGPNVVIDRIILTQDASCIPDNTLVLNAATNTNLSGENCATPPDTTPPVVSISSPANNATVSSSTTATASASDDVAVSKVEWYVDNTLKGTDTTAPYNFTIDPTAYALGSHVLKAVAYDAAGNSASSTTVTFKIPDTTQPAVSITYPTANANVGNSITATVNASDNVGVVKVEYYLDQGSNTPSVATSTSSPFSAPIDLSALADGTHSIAAIAYDLAGNSKGSAWVSFNLTKTSSGDSTPPALSLTAPANGATISGKTYNVAATATDASGVKQVQFYVDNVLKSTDTTSPYSYTLDTSTLANGSHAIKVVATDNSANANTSTVTANVTVSNYRAEDINQDGLVDILDFSLLAAKFNQTGSGLGRADINTDGTVDILDFSLLAAKFNT